MLIDFPQRTSRTDLLRPRMSWCGRSALTGRGRQIESGWYCQIRQTRPCAGFFVRGGLAGSKPQRRSTDHAWRTDLQGVAGDDIRKVKTQDPVSRYPFRPAARHKKNPAQSRVSVFYASRTGTRCITKASEGCVSNALRNSFGIQHRKHVAFLSLGNPDRTHSS